MRITPQLTDEAVLAELGARLARMRLERNMTQLELAAASGVDRKALLRMEGGDPIVTTNLIRILRALELTDRIDQLVPEPLPSPVELLKTRGKPRQRASGVRGKAARLAHERATWRWGDEASETGR